MNFIRRTARLYRAQIEVMWRWRPGRAALLRRVVVAFLASLVAFWITAWLMPGLLQITQLGGGFLAVLFISGINLLVRPVLLGLVMARSLVALVLLTLLVQALVLWLLTPVVPGVTVHAGLLGALLVSFVFGFITAGVSALFGLGEDDSYYSTLMRTLAGRREDVVRTEEPGLVIIQVDGLSHDVFTHAVRAGRVPELSGWIRSGSHKLGHWEALLPCTTPASQAGILHGTNDGIPNFRWWEKKNRRLLVANHPEDATEIERRISNGEGLLSPGGASISNIFTGDGDRAYLVMSTIKVKERGLGSSEAFAWFFVSPYNYLVMGAKFFAEVVKERVQSWRQQRAGMVPHMGHHRGFPYPWVRAATNVALRGLGTSLIIQEMLRGTPVIYMDYTDYDEIAHHSGPERAESMDALDGVDRELRTLRKAAEDAPRPYRFVILADHGQSLGETFLQRYGVTLQHVVRSLMGGTASVAAATAQVEDWGQLNVFLGEVSATKGMSGSIARRLRRDSSTGEQTDVGPDAMEYTPAGAATASAPSTGATKPAGSDQPADLIVVAGGNLALIYFDTSDERMTLEEVDAAYPDLVRALANHPGVGITLVRSADRGLLAVGRSGIHYLDDDRVEGDDPLAVYGPYAATALRRLDDIEHVGDIAVISLYDPETGEIAAFEELIGAHGGLGGAQNRPFLLYPSDWHLDLAPIVGAPMVYQQLRAWMERELGMRFGPHAESAPAQATAATVPPAPPAPTTPPAAG